MDARERVMRSNRRRRVLRRSARRPLLRALRWTLGLLPPLVASVSGHVLGTLAYLASARTRSRTLDNLDLAYGDTLSPAEKRRIARRSLAYAGRGALMLASLARRGPERALGHLRIEGLEHLEGILEQGKGCIWVTFHYGFFDLFGAWGCQRFGSAAVGREVPPDSPTEVLHELRAQIGLEMIERGDVRTLLRVLRDNRPLALLSDHDVSDVKGCFVPFFGRLAHTPVGPAALSIRTGAAVVVGFVEWEGWTRHVGRIEPPLRARDDLPREEAILDLTRRYTQIGEAYVRRRPDQWLWMHKRWHTRPEDHPDWPVWQSEPAD